MRLSLSSLFVIFICVCFSFADSTPSYIVFYPYGTPEATKAEAKAIIIKSGGKIMYEYKNFNAFAATIPGEVMDRVRKLGNPQINKDEIQQLDGKNGI